MIVAVLQKKSSGPKIVLLAVLALSGWHCLDAPNYPDEPYIEFLDVSKDTMLQGFFMEDSITVSIRFEDGDGDLGRVSQDSANNVFFIDERSGEIETYGIPAIPQEGAANGVEGEIRIVVFSTCCYYNDGEDPCVPHPTIRFDTIQYRIYILDQAQNKSNEILTSPIILRCD